MVWAAVGCPGNHLKGVPAEWEGWFASALLSDHGIDDNPVVEGVSYDFFLGSLGGDAKTTRRGRNYQVLVDACELLIKRLEAA